MRSHRFGAVYVVVVDPVLGGTVLIIAVDAVLGAEVDTAADAVLVVVVTVMISAGSLCILRHRHGSVRH